VGLDLRLPKGDLAAGGDGEDAPPADRAFARLEYRRRPERTSPLHHIDEVGDLDVGQPQGALAVVFDDAAVDRVAELQRQVAAGPDLDRFCGSAEHPRVEVRSAREVAGVEL
jgi:hypothetical protein